MLKAISFNVSGNPVSTVKPSFPCDYYIWAVIWSFQNMAKVRYLEFGTFQAVNLDFLPNFREKLFVADFIDSVFGGYISKNFLCGIFWVYTAHCTLYTIHCTLNTVHCALCNVHCTLNTVHCSLCTQSPRWISFTETYVIMILADGLKFCKKKLEFLNVKSFS